MRRGCGVAMLATATAAAILLFSTCTQAAVLNEERHKLAPNYYGEITREQQPFHRRVKRAFLNAIGIDNVCNAGWTGQFCENPICHDTQEPLVPFETDMAKVVDTLYLPENCAGEYYVPYDSSTDELIITVTTNAGRPVVNLTDGTGVVHGALEQTGNDGYGRARYRTNPGAYLVSVDLKGVPSKLCIVHIEARSKITFDGGFVINPYGDRPPFGESSEANVPSYFIAHPFALSSPAEVRTVTIRDLDRLSPLYRSVLTRRYQCAYEYYAGEFQCQVGRKYLYTVDGIDAQGFNFRRSRNFGCYGVGPTVVPPTIPAPVTECLNGGTLVNVTNPMSFNSSMQSTFCFCKEFYTGRQCEQLLCMNGGLTLDDDPYKCDCPDGYVGQSCENVICDPNVGKILTDEKQLIVVIRDTASMAPNVNAIVQAIETEYVNHMTAGRSVYNGFVLITFSNGVNTAKAYEKKQYATFLADLEKIAKSEKVGNCTDNILAATRLAFVQLENFKSPIFVFTDVVADDSDVPNWYGIMELNAIRKFQINTFYLDSSNTTGCQLPDPNSRGVTVFESLAAYSGGLVYAPSRQNLQQVFFLAMRTTTYHMNLVDSGDLRECQAAQQTFIVDTSAEAFIVVARGINLNLVITDPAWNVLYVEPVFSADNTFFWEVPKSQLIVGEYIYSIHSSNPSTPCAYRMLTQSEFDLFLGTTDAVDNDVIMSEPAVGFPTHIVAQLNGFYGGYVRDPFRLFAEVLITTVDESGAATPAYYSSGTFRSSCGFHLYFGIADFCRYEDQMFYATVFVDDEFGYTVQRKTVGMCRRAFGPEPTPGPDDCKNGGVPVNSTYCLCPAHFLGAKCEQIECQNGGSPLAERCDCPYGLTGRFCEILTCPVKDDLTEATPDHRTLSIIVSTRSSMRAAVAALAGQVDEFVRDYYSNNPEWFEYFTIIIVNQTDVRALVAPDAQTFAKNMKYLSDNFDLYSDASNTNCPVQINVGLTLALAHTFDNSPIFVFADSAAVNSSDPISLLDIVDTADSLHAPITFFGLDPEKMCDGNGTFGGFEEGVAAFTGGNVFYTSAVDQLLTYITTLYNSGLVSVRQSKSCNTDGIDFYFPVDVQTKSFTIAVDGVNANVTLIPPNGQPAKTYKSSIINEKLVTIDQYITACEFDWDPNGQYCHRFSEDAYTWLDAFTQCFEANRNAFLVDILSKNQYDFLRAEAKGFKIWLGLVKNGTTQSDFFFYQPNGLPNIALNNTFAKDFWAPGQDFANPDFKHVYMDTTDGLWYLAKQADTNFFICQLHRFGKGFEPMNINTLLPAGYWRAQVKTENANCSVQIRTQSPIQIYYGFVQDQHNDFVRGTANIDSASNFVAATGTGLAAFNPRPGPSPEGKINYVTIVRSQTDVFPLAMSPRADCLFDSVSQPFKCPADNHLDQIFLKFTGIDQYGYPFERYTASRCDKYITRCYNGGFARDGACICMPFWAGIDCRSPLCQNGAKATPEGTCACTQFHTGKFCELAVCDPPYPQTFPTEGRTLVIMLETSFEMSLATFYLKKNLTSLLKANAAANPGWFTKYMLVPFDSAANQALWYPNITTTKIDDLHNVLSQIDVGDCLGNNCNISCPRPISSILQTVLQSGAVAVPDSTILVITHASIEDYTLATTILPLLQEARVQIHFALVGATTPCNLGWNNPMAEAMQFYARFTSGSVTSLIPLDLTTGWLAKYLPALHKQQLVAVEGLVGLGNCAAAEYIFQIDHGTTSFIVEHFADSLDYLYIIGPKATNVTKPANIIPSSSSYIGVFEVDKNEFVPGTYILRASSQNARCALNVRATTSIQITPGYVQIHDLFKGATQDDAHFAPLTNGRNVLVVHADGLEHGRLEGAHIRNPLGDVEVNTALLRRDDACTFTYYAEQYFECHYSIYEVVIFGTDNMGQPFHRNFYTPCVETRPPLPPPPPSCDLETLKVDLVFVVDTSELVKNTTLLNNMMLSIVLTTFKYTLDPIYARVGLMTLSDKPEQGGYFNLRMATPDNFHDLLANITADGGKGQDITLGVQALMADFFTKINGYRIDATVRHHVVYMTASDSPTDADPDNAVLALKTNNIAGWSVVGVNVQNPSQKLLSLANEDCRYFAKTLDDMLKNVPNFINNLHCSRFPRCGM